MTRYQILPPFNYLFAIDFPNAIPKMIIDTETGNMFTESEDNTDYQAYLAWVAEGNTAEEWEGM
jgi:hypothetical protein